MMHGQPHIRSENWYKGGKGGAGLYGPEGDSSSEEGYYVEGEMPSTRLCTAMF